MHKTKTSRNHGVKCSVACDVNSLNLKISLEWHLDHDQQLVSNSIYENEFYVKTNDKFLKSFQSFQKVL